MNRTRTIFLSSVGALSFASYLLAQCVVGTNQPDFLWDGVYHQAWPKYGSRAQAGATWLNMPTSGIQYIYCPASPGGCLPSPGGGDYNFTGSQITSMQSAFTAFANAKTANGSNLTFNRIYTSTYGTDPFVIAILSMSTSAMGTTLARQITTGMNVVDVNNDGVGDGERLVDIVFEVRNNVTTQLTGVFVHELGHSFGLEDCPGCTTGTTIMKTPYSAESLTAPSACDNAKIASIM